MALELRAICPRCDGIKKVEHNQQYNEDGNFVSSEWEDPCILCAGVGLIEIGDIADFSERLGDLEDKVNDVMDKCNDIFEQVSGG